MIQWTLPPSCLGARLTLSLLNVRTFPPGFPLPLSFVSINLLLFQSAVSAQRSSSVQSQGQAARRRLPPIPGNSSSPPTPGTNGMPEPRPYRDSALSQDS
jgi:hypothetical protein